MIKIKSHYLEEVAGATKENLTGLHHGLQNAILLEHATIPPYLTAYFSLKGSTNDQIAKMIHRVLVEEMLHMVIAANLLIAIGGKPKFNDPNNLPQYPGQLPLGIADNLTVNLEKFSKALVKNTFMEIETPVEPLDIDFRVQALGAEEEEYVTIGEFYRALLRQITMLGNDIFTQGIKHQVTGLSYPGFGDKLFPITNVATAAKAIAIIERQGEGTILSPFDADGNPAHYYLFESIYQGKALLIDPENPRGYGVGEDIPFDPEGVWDLPINPTLEDYKEQPQEQAKVRAFALTYSAMLDDLQTAFSGNPEEVYEAIGKMFELSRAAKTLCSHTNASGQSTPLGLVFDYIPSPAPGFKWRPTNAPVASSRTDDVYFTDAQTGWAVNSNGQIIHTTDGGANWTEQIQGDMYWRCINMVNASVGWAGSLTEEHRLYATLNGGAKWTRVANLPEQLVKICGLTALDEKTVIGTGTNEPDDTAGMVITMDAGKTWHYRDLSEHATLLIDNHFVSPEKGWVVGGYSEKETPTRDDVVPVILYTEDGGGTWENLAEGTEGLRVGEWGWKLFFLNDQTIFVSLEAFNWGAFLRSDDGGKSWTRHAINDPQVNANLEGIGFVSKDVGWVGGWGDAQFTRGATSSTVDGGLNWDDSNHVGRFINRFRFIGDPLQVGYASGWTVYKFSDSPVPPPLQRIECELLDNNNPLQVESHLTLGVTIPEGAKRLRAMVWDRFGKFIWSIEDEFNPDSGPKLVEWDFVAMRDGKVPVGQYIVRITVDGKSESVLVKYLGKGEPTPSPDPIEVRTYSDLQRVLNQAVGGESPPVGAHGAFWRSLSRDEFVERSIFGIKLVEVGNGAESGLVKCLRGEAPFGSDQPNPPQGATYRRMPAGMEAVPEATITAIVKWINAGAKE